MRNFKFSLAPAFIADAAMIIFFVTAPVALATSVTEGYSDIHGLTQAKYTLSEAISVAQNERDGQAVFAQYKTEYGEGRYEVQVVSHGELDVMTVDPKSGQAQRKEWERVDKTRANSAEKITHAPISIAQAISAAESQGGKAVGARFDTKKGKSTYRVDVADGVAVSTVWIDTDSGHIIEKS